MHIDPYYQCHDSSFGKYKAYADIRGGSSGRGPQMTLRLSTTAIFGDLGGYFFGNVRDKANNIIRRYATGAPCVGL